MSNSEFAGKKQRPAHLWQKGQSGNPAGKPKGTRHKITEEFLTTFAADIAIHGASVVERVRNERPEIYMKIWAELLPRQTQLDATLGINIVTETTNVLEAFRTLTELVGADPELGMQRLKKLAPRISYNGG
jgi:Family of unknown function (DUF5681)